MNSNTNNTNVMDGKHPWLGCPFCISRLQVVKNFPGEKCFACKREMNDPIVEALAGHWACCPSDKAGIPSKCGVHLCQDCRFGPISLASGDKVSAFEISRVMVTGRTCVECAKIEQNLFPSCGNKETCKNVDLVWSAPGILMCLNCKTTRTASEPTHCANGHLMKAALYLGQPRNPDVNRRRLRSPSPVNIKREPKSPTAVNDNAEDDDSSDVVIVEKKK